MIVKRLIGKIEGTDELGVLFGYAIVCNEDGKPYVDLQNEHIPQKAMLKASLAFARGSRKALLMHNDDTWAGQVVYVLPVTEDVAKSLGLKTKKYGMIVGIEPNDPKVLLMAKAGMLTGFSIGGKYVKTVPTEMEV